MTDDEEEDAICGKLIKIGRGRGRMVTAPVLGGSATSLQVRKYQQDPSGRLYKRGFLGKQTAAISAGGWDNNLPKCKQPKKNQKTVPHATTKARAEQTGTGESDVWRRRQ